MKPLVSAIIPAYNYSAYVREAIDSALRQSYPNMEVIVVNDGSTDNTLELLKEYKERITIVDQKNQGLSQAKNNGVKVAKGEYFAFLDADDIWLPEKIEKQMQLFDQEKPPGLVHCALEEIDAGGSILSEIKNGQSGEVANEILLLKKPAILGGGSGAIISRSIFEEVGEFDPKLSTSHDWDMYFRIACKSHVAFSPEILLQYRLHGNNMHSNVDNMRKDVMYAFKKVFQNPIPQIQSLKREAYGNMYLMLSGSYFGGRHFGKSIIFGIKSILTWPPCLAYIADYPIRKLQRIKNLGTSTQNS